MAAAAARLRALPLRHLVRCWDACIAQVHYLEHIFSRVPGTDMAGLQVGGQVSHLLLLRPSLLRRLLGLCPKACHQHTLQAGSCVACSAFKLTVAIPCDFSAVGAVLVQSSKLKACYKCLCAI